MLRFTQVVATSNGGFTFATNVALPYMFVLLEKIRLIPTRFLLRGMLLLALPAFIINLHLAAFIGDEGIRALVALEMKLSGNYVATTMHGASYINKPPLFNWLLVIASELWGGYGEWPSRLTTVFFLGVFGYTVYRFVKPEMGRESAVLAGLLTVTSGRFLIYDSMLALIDTTFSWVTYLQFMCIWWFGTRQRWLGLFLSTYLLTTAGFMLKGLPAIVFQGLSIPAGLWLLGHWRKLFSWQHVAGGLLFSALLGAYLWWYAQYRPLDILLPNLLNESVKRTVVEHGWLRFVVHLFSFPFEWIYHFLPFSVTFICWLDRRIGRRLRENRFLSFNLTMLLANLPVYWTSVHVEARYLLMFIPLFTVINQYLLEQDRLLHRWTYRLIYALFGLALCITAVSISAMPLIPRLFDFPNLGWIAGGFGLLATLIALMYLQDPQRYLWWFVAGLFVFRIVFDLVILPLRNEESVTAPARTEAIRLGEKYKDRNLYIYGRSDNREPAAFYLTKGAHQVIKRDYNLSHPNAVYLVNPVMYPQFPGRIVDTLQTDYRDVVLYFYEMEE
ncbi:MAG: hypothetical protein U0U46_09690 [Saprospiraceae bacterium]